MGVSAAEKRKEGRRLAKFLRWKCADFVTSLMWCLKERLVIKDYAEVADVCGFLNSRSIDA